LPLYFKFACHRENPKKSGWFGLKWDVGDGIKTTKENTETVLGHCVVWVQNMVSHFEGGTQNRGFLRTV
jgi:hypothetical protein